MSELRIETRTMPAADLGHDNPLPQLAVNVDRHAAGSGDKKTFGQVNGSLPYALQDGYNRNKKPRAFATAVLENDILRATFMLEAGGRLWSLLHKPTGRDLLHVNPVFQPANLAIRNAWFSGGVEWNCGIIGHTPYTCSPLFAARLKMDDGTPVLRLWEWERIRQVAYQIDAFLPDGSSVLFVRPRIINTFDHDIAMYWWSNIAVDEKPGLRVVAPADVAAHFGYIDGVQDTPIPIHDGVDVSYPTNLGRAQDYFYTLPDERRKYIAAVDESGQGLAQTSTDRLLGRKLFLWGRGSGGRQWQEYLAAKDCAYIEIQAGLARTQMDYVRMPARADWSWLEAYGLVQADPKIAHGSDWHAAQREIESRLDQLIPRAALDQVYHHTSAMADRPPLEILHRGSGWGLLEQMRRRRHGERPICGPSMVFDDASLGPDQQPWLILLEKGRFPEGPADQCPGSFMVQPQWRTLLEVAITGGHSRHWRSWWHLGVMRYHAGQVDAAKQAWQESFSAAPTAWALRNLAVAANAENKPAESTSLYIRACHLAPGLIPLAVEAGTMLVETNQPRAWLDLLPCLASDVQRSPRVKLLQARAQLKLGDVGPVEEFLFSGLVVPDIREGEVSLSDLWFGLQERRIADAEHCAIDDALHQRVRKEFPPPASLDFRMNH